MYCGDETGAFIGDIGSHTARFGYGGDNAPVLVTPSIVGERSRRDTDGSSPLRRRRVVPTSCYSHRWCYDNDVNDTPANAAAEMAVNDVAKSPLYEFQSPMRMASSYASNDHDTTTGGSPPQPLTDPVAYLAQGDMIQNWDAYEHLWTNALDALYVKDTLKHTTGRRTEQKASSGVTSRTIPTTGTVAAGDSKCIHPFLVVSPGCTYSVRADTDTTGGSATSQKQLVQLTELLVETLGATAVFVAPTPMLAAFCHGRQSCLLVDIGASGTCVTPVVDGLLLQQAQRRSGRGGDWLDNCAWQALLLDDPNNNNNNNNNNTSQSTSIDTSPRRMLTPRYQNRQTSSSSLTTNRYGNGVFYKWAMRDLMYELRTSEHVAVPQWWYDPSVPFHYYSTGEVDMEVESPPAVTTPTNATSGAKSCNANYYELPDGTMIDMTSRVGKDLCRLPELLFGDEVPFQNLWSTAHEASSQSILSQHITLSNLSLPKLVHSSLSAVTDVDVRKDLAASIVLTGGCAVTKNLEQRLSLELPRITSAAYKPKVLASRHSVERQAAAWIGASILSSLGSFQQLWLSKTEYEEYGATLAVQRFP